MAQSMIRRRQEAERHTIEIIEETLRLSRRVRRQPPDFARALNEAHAGFGDTVRRASDWHPKLKSRNPDRLRLAAAQHLFAIYPVAPHLEQIWLDTEGLNPAEVLLRKRWYVTVAGGDSLFRQGAGTWLSRKEVHRFVNPPPGLGFEEAWWTAIAGSYTADAGIVSRIARSKIARTPRDETHFWRDVARFFIANPATKEQIDDLCDYIAYRRDNDVRYRLKGRTLESLTRQMRAWHEDINILRDVEAHIRRTIRSENGAAADHRSWKGAPLKDWFWEPTDKKARATARRFVVTQIKTATDLVAESRMMRHCVWSYVAKCLVERCSIWSLREKTTDRVDRLLTIELDRSLRAVQVRGKSNRLPTPDEERILARWSQEMGVTLI